MQRDRRSNRYYGAYSTKDLTGTVLPACTAVTDYTPTGRRRKRGVKEMGLIHENNILHASVEVKGTYDALCSTSTCIKRL